MQLKTQHFPLQVWLSGALQDMQLKTQHFPLQLVVSPVRSSKVSLPADFTQRAAWLPGSGSLLSLLRISLEVVVELGTSSQPPAGVLNQVGRFFSTSASISCTLLLLAGV